MSVHLDHRVHGFHELAWLANGTVTVCIKSQRWPVHAGQALWIPAGVEHDVEIPDATLITPFWFDPATVEMPWTTPTALAVDRETGRRMARITQLWLSHELSAAAATEAMAGVLPTLQHRAPGITMPRSAPARAVGQALLADPRDDRTLHRWAEEVHVGERTLRRAFLNETTLNFVEWRTMVRLLAAMPMLAAGDPVGTVANRVGYTSANGFIAAFRKYLGTTPARFAQR